MTMSHDNTYPNDPKQNGVSYTEPLNVIVVSEVMLNVLVPYPPDYNFFVTYKFTTKL